MWRSRLVLLAAAAGLACPAAAQEDELDLSFLEYLGSWQEGDEEWVLVAELEEGLEDENEVSASDDEMDETDEE